MSVKNFEITSIDAERYTEKGGEKQNVRVDHNSSVKKVKAKDKKTAQFSFRFTVDYSGLGRMELEGNILYAGKASKLAAKWQKENEMPDKVAKDIHSTIISNCIPEAVVISREIQLPPPIPMPQVDISQGEDKEGKRGMEVA